MAFAYINISGANSKTSGASVAVVSGFAVAAGDLIVVQVAVDNIATTNGLTSNITSVTDNQGNIYTKEIEATQQGGAANSGVTAGLFWAIAGSSYASGALTITANLSGSVTAKTISFMCFSRDTSKVITVQDKTFAGNDLSSVSISLSGLPLRDYLFVGFNSAENTVTNTSGFGGSTVYATAGGGSASNIAQAVSKSIETGTGKSSSASSSSGQDKMFLIAAFYEETPGDPVINNKFFQFFLT